MAQDGEVGQGPDSQLGPPSQLGPYSELRAAERREYQVMVERDHRFEKRLWWKEIAALLIAVVLTTTFAWLGGRL